jgi:membrane associated rhomboid family serine protease
MEQLGLISFIIIAITVVVSYKGFKSHAFLERYSFQVDEVLIRKDYKRLITSGFLHSGWMHLLFNMISFYYFSSELEDRMGAAYFLIIYFGSMAGGSLFSLYIHRNHPDYSAIGASGAVSGIVFASIALFPGMEIGLLLFPGSIPGWAFGLLYVLVSIYGIRSQRDNIGHDAHLGGGIVGLLIAIAMFPEILRYNYLPILMILIPSAVFIYLIVKRPEFLLVNNLFEKQRSFHNADEKYNYHKREKEKELDRLLDKINRRGMGSLTPKEKEKLKEYSSR